MSDSLKLETLRAGDRDALLASRGYRDLVALGAAAVAADGQPPFNDQTLVDARAGRCVFTLAYIGDTLAGAAVVNGDTLELVIDPALRGRGFGAALTAHVLDEDKLLGGRRRPHVSYLSRLLEPFQSDAVLTIPTLAWSHGDHPAAAVLAKQHGFVAVRTLLQLRMPLDRWLSSPQGVSKPAAAVEDLDTPLRGYSISDEAKPAAAAGDLDTPPGGYSISDESKPAAAAEDLDTPPRGYSISDETFVPGRDDDEWVALNARVFAGHPEQGRITVDDLHARMAEPWFDADDFLVARDASGAMVGYNWLKIEPAPSPAEKPEPGEIYVIGVAPEAAGAGLGRALLQRGLNRLAARGCTEAALYTDDDNAAAVALYRSVGFVDHTVDVQYAQR